jgi:hypothetical protein
MRDSCCRRAIVGWALSRDRRQGIQWTARNFARNGKTFRETGMHRLRKEHLGQMGNDSVSAVTRAEAMRCCGMIVWALDDLRPYLIWMNFYILRKWRQRLCQHKQNAWPPWLPSSRTATLWCPSRNVHSGLYVAYVGTGLALRLRTCLSCCCRKGLIANVIITLKDIGHVVWV